ncbi:hypothetical protein [Phaeodactylibacter sp.]|uniref:hypothetical protein n=1 Tax=Phaeodactylibacter sp. TaxID=1940289 RepID=UPI0025E92C55|nr:hypothetical protein [Phaeodactylibacter sp.]MCI4648858.1 hypothetical protein [Phaeodactylibacter sp.]MCI5092821.1 hypothetical protein [Phaeodactylibacter sp.]
MQTKNTTTPSFPRVNNDYLGFRIDQETKSILVELARADRRTLTSYMQKIVSDHIAEVRASSEPDSKQPPGPK